MREAKGHNTAKWERGDAPRTAAVKFLKIEFEREIRKNTYMILHLSTSPDVRVCVWPLQRVYIYKILEFNNIDKFALS